MSVLPVTFKILSICGCWRPNGWTSTCKKIVYSAYTVFVLLLVHTFALSQIMDMIVSVNTIEEFIDNVYAFLAMMVGCCKMVSLLANKGNIMILTDMFSKEHFKPVNAEEVNIYRGFESLIRLTTLRYVFSIELTVLIFSITSYLTDFKRKVLSFRVWLPYDYSSSAAFFFATLHQNVGWALGSLHHVAADALFCGLLMHTYGQFDLLECRLKRIRNDGKDKLRDCVRHHNQIYLFATTINEMFKPMIFTQFIVSTLIVCFNLVQLVKIKSFTSEIFQLVMYMFSMLLQIFLYCWCGNEVRSKSVQLSSKIFEMDWTPLDNGTRKLLIMIMKRTRTPVEFTSAYIIAINIDSFVNLLKTSYSAYNLLQQTRQ